MILKRILGLMSGQMFLSITNFIINLTFLKLSTPEDFGEYSFWFSLGLFFVGVHNAFVTTPLSVEYGDNKLKSISHASRMNLILVFIVFLITTLVTFVLYKTTYSSLLYALYISVLLIKEYLKTCYLVIYKKVNLSFFSDLIFSVFMLLGVGGLSYYNYVMTNSVIFICTFCQLLSLVTYLNKNTIKLIFSYKNMNLEMLKDGFWSFLGVIVTELQSRGYIYIVKYLLGSSVLGMIQSGKVLFGPVSIIINSWSRVSRPIISYKLTKDNKSAMSYLILSLFVFIVLDLSIILMIYLCESFIRGNLINSSYDGMLKYIYIWMFVLIVTHVRGCFSVYYQCMGEYKNLTMIISISACVSLLLIVFCYFDYSYVPLSVGFSEFLIISLILKKLVDNVATKKRECN